MPTRITEIVVDSAELAPIARFWSALLDWPITVDEDDEIFVEGKHFGIVFGRVAEPKTVKNRVHLDVTGPSVAKALDLGARHIDIGQGDVRWTVLADPDGNEFCVIDQAPEDTGTLVSITMDCADPAAIAPFWAAATGLRIDRGDENFVGLRPVDGGPWLALDRVPDPKLIKNRVHIDVAPFAGDDHEAEVERLISLGARRIDIGQGDVPWVVMADPEGNEFCVLTPRD
jgi:glyoxalase superfamily protein